MPWTLPAPFSRTVTALRKISLSRPHHPSLRAVFVLAATASTSILLLPSYARAQASEQERSHPAVERYNRTAKGANVEEWKKRLSDPDARTRLDAVDSLGTKGGDDAIKPLIEATSDEDYRVRTRAIDFLGALRAVEATPVLMQLLFLTDIGRDEKLRTLTALSRIDDPTTSDRLVSYAATINDNDLACRAVYAVGETGTPEVKDKLAALRGTRPGSDLDRLVTDALVKIDLRAKNKPIEQPTLIELEKKLARQQEAAKKKQ
ncbi:MAG TPA: HEAT repeat domain-containing protein [Candidatus Limnocylindrales bacterium]|nr:HEAT repeat domain-containing protein [Candidatus Limnocylindrales bacterium]